MQIPSAFTPQSVSLDCRLPLPQIGLGALGYALVLFAVAPEFRPRFGPFVVHRTLLWLAMVGLALVQTGCVSRRITVKTVPPGALVEMNGERLGLSPVSKSFTYYGTNEFKVSLPGYETIQVQQPTPAPWYQKPPLDFVTDNFLPFRIRDHREFTYQLTPRNTLQELDEQALRNRGENFRSQSQSGPIQ